MFFLALALALASQGQPIAQPHLALVDANVIDVRTGDVTTGATVVLQGGKIVSIGAAAPPSGVETIDLGGAYVLPGLVDAHTHLDSLEQAERALRSGVTTVRGASVGSYRDVVIGEMTEAGILWAGISRLRTPYIGSGVLADARLMHLAVPIETEGLEDARAGEYRERRARHHAWDRPRGAPTTDPREQVYTSEQLQVVVDEAAKHGISVLCHAHGDEGARAAVLAGVRSIDHGTYMSDETLRLMKEKGTYFVPTYTTMIDLIEPGGDYDNPVVKIRGLHMLPHIEETIERAHAMGIPIVTGADTSYGPESVVRITIEMVNFVKLGMTPLEAIRSATLVATEMLGISDRTGVLDVGMEADILVVSGNPLEDIRAVQDVIVVVSNGRVGLNRLPFAKN